MTRDPYNAAKARAKRPLPLWMDAILADTQHLEPDEFGVYVRILGAMWRRESCDLPNDPKRLAIIGGVSMRLWSARVGPAIMPFFSGADTPIITQKRLQVEAKFQEKTLQAQSDRKRPDEKSDPCAKPTGDNNAPHENDEKSDNVLKYNDLASTADYPPIEPRIHPTYNLHKKEEEEEEEREAIPEGSFFDRVLTASGLNKNDIPSPHWMPPRAEVEVARWLRIAPGILTEDLILQHITESRKWHAEKPHGPKAFEFGLRSLAKTLIAPIPTPIAGGAAAPRAPAFDLEKMMSQALSNHQPQG